MLGIGPPWVAQNPRRNPISLIISRRAFLAAAALPAFARQGTQARTPGVLTFGLSSYPPNLQPWTNTGTAAGTVKLMIFRGLLSYDGNGALRPELAESFSQDGATAWIFKLRAAVFHNGEPVTSADAKWTLQQIAAEKSAAYLRTEMQGIDKVETPDEKTIRVVMKQPTATLPQWVANYNMPIIWHKSQPNRPIGAGPFVLKAQEHGVSIELEAFAKFYKPGLPKLKGIRAVAYADESRRVAALQAGDVDLIEYVPWQSMEAIANDPQLRLDATDGPFVYLVFNGTRPPFNDVRVRQAIAHAVRREEIVNAAFFGRGSPLTHLPIAQASEFFNPELANSWKYDPELAKKLLAEAGYASGFSCNFLSTAQYGMHKDSAKVVQQNLAEVGIKAKLNLPDWATRVALGNKGHYELAMMGTATDSNDPDGLANVLDGSLSPSLNRSFGLAVPTITELLVAGRAEFALSKRKAIYRAMEAIAIAEVPIVGLAWRSQGYAMRNDVIGFKNLPGALTFYSGLTLEDVSAG
jgi:ABC-type transport system substrate-binding protein